MSKFEVFAERQPWEEQQVESPTEEVFNPSPLELALARTRSPTSPTSPTLPTYPTSPTERSRRLSSDPGSPPPAWKRRPSVGQRSTFSNSSQNSDQSSSIAGSPPFPSPPPPPPNQRRPPPNLIMTRASVAQRLLRENEPAHLRVPTRPPPGAYRRRAGTVGTTGSNRSSMHSQDGMTSEDLWNIEDDTPDLSNPMRLACERPLDTVNRMSQRFDQPFFPLGSDVLWPTAPPEDYQPPPKTKSLTNVTSIKRRSGTLKKRSSQNDSMNAPYPHNMSPARSKDALSSAHSSTTSLSMPINKSHTSLNSRTPSHSYSLDLMSSLMPREGGYAVAAQIGYAGTPITPVDIDRRSFGSNPPNSYRGPRGPAAKSSGMRWSLDPEEYYNPQPPSLNGRLSPATTVSSLGDENDNSSPISPQYMSAPAAPSPLSQQTTAAEVTHTAPPPAAATESNVPTTLPLPVPATPARSKTRKERKAEEKAAKETAKAEAKRAAQEKAEAEARARVEAKRAAEQEAKAKQELKAQAKAEAAKKKGEGKTRSKTLSIKRVPSFHRKSQVINPSEPVPGLPPAAAATAAAAKPSSIAGLPGTTSTPGNAAHPVATPGQSTGGRPAAIAAAAAGATAAALPAIVIPQRSTSAAHPNADAPSTTPASSEAMQPSGNVSVPVTRQSPPSAMAPASPPAASMAVPATVATPPIAAPNASVPPSTAPVPAPVAQPSQTSVPVAAPVPVSSSAPTARMNHSSAALPMVVAAATQTTQAAPAPTAAPMPSAQPVSAPSQAPQHRAPVHAAAVPSAEHHRSHQTPVNMPNQSPPPSGPAQQAPVRQMPMAPVQGLVRQMSNGPAQQAPPRQMPNGQVPNGQMPNAQQRMPSLPVQQMPDAQQRMPSPPVQQTANMPVRPQMPRVPSQPQSNPQVPRGTPQAPVAGPAPAPRPSPHAPQTRVAASGPRPETQQPLPAPTPRRAAPVNAPTASPPAIAVSKAPSSVASSRDPSRKTSSPSISSTVRASNSSQVSTPPPKKKGLFSSLKKRFSVSALDTSPNVQARPRPSSVVVGDNVSSRGEKDIPSVPPAPLVASSPGVKGRAAPQPATPSPALSTGRAISQNATPSPPPKPRASAPAQASIPPPIVVPPRNSSLATGGNGLSPVVASPEHDAVDRQPSLSNPSSVVVTPTASMAATSAGSLFDIRRPVVRERSDSGTSASASNMTDHDVDKTNNVLAVPQPSYEQRSEPAVSTAVTAH